MDGGPPASSATPSDLNFRNLLPLSIGLGRGVYTPLPTRPAGAPPRKATASSSSAWRRLPRASGPLGDVGYLLIILVVSIVVASALLASRRATGELESTRSRATSGVLLAVSLLVTAWRTWILLRQSLATYTTPETSAEHPVRRFSGVLAIFALNVVTLAHAYTFVTTIDAASVTNTDRDSALLYVFLDSLYDMTLVASGTGFGERVPVGWGAKLVAFVCAAYLTIGMSMTVFARILSSGAMYWGEREGAREGVREGVREAAALGARKASPPWA